MVIFAGLLAQHAQVRNAKFGIERHQSRKQLGYQPAQAQHKTHHLTTHTSPQRSDARPASAVPLKGDWANRASNPSNLTKRRSWGTAPASAPRSKTWPNVGSLRSYPTKLLLGAYCGEAYDIRQAWQDLFGTTRHFVPPFFTFEIAPLARPSTLGLLGRGSSTHYWAVKLIAGLKVQNPEPLFLIKLLPTGLYA